jgi:hypothetical protein
MALESQFGPRLSEEEYRRGILALYRDLPPLPSPDQDTDTRWQELNLAVDYRLGRAFPQERRLALWAVQQRIEKKRLRLAAKYLLRRFVSRILARHAQELAGYAAEEFAKVLSPQELRRFLDLKENEPPALPIDLEHLRR